MSDSKTLAELLREAANAMDNGNVNVNVTGTPPATHPRPPSGQPGQASATTTSLARAVQGAVVQGKDKVKLAS